MMILLSLVVIVLVIIEGGTVNVDDAECPNVKTPLSSIRKRRHLTFGAGTNVVLTISLVKAFMTHAPAGWNIALEIDVLFPMPDANFTNAFYRKKLHHRQKREFWDRFKNALEIHNMDGHSSILKSICEAKSDLAPAGQSLVHDILRAIFTVPLHDEDFMEEVKHSYSELTDPDFCDKVNNVPISLLQFVLEFNKEYN